VSSWWLLAQVSLCHIGSAIRHRYFLLGVHLMLVLAPFFHVCFLLSIGFASSSICTLLYIVQIAIAESAALRRLLGPCEGERWPRRQRHRFTL
jgi:hypothetical protein